MRDKVEVFPADVLFFEVFHHGVAHGGESDFAQEFRHRARDGAGQALNDIPAEEVQADDEREQQIVHKLRDKGRRVAADAEREKIGLFNGFCNQKVQKIVQKRGSDERDATTHDDVPGRSDGLVERAVYQRFTALNVALRPRPGNDRNDEKNERDEKIDEKRHHGENVRRALTVPSRHDVHGKKRYPREKYPAVERKPVEPQIDALVRKQVHANNGRNEKRDEQGGNVP